MTSSRTRLLSVLAASGALAIGMATPAWAGTYSHRDARHDVAGGLDSGGNIHRAPRDRKSDITHLRVVNSASTVRINVALRSSSMVGLQWRTLGFALKTDGDTYLGDWVEHPHKEHQFDLIDYNTGHRRQCGSEVRGTEGHTIWLSLDPSCLDHPRWIRAAVSVSTFNGKSECADNAQSANWRRFGREVFSPRIQLAP